MRMLRGRRSGVLLGVVALIGAVTAGMASAEGDSSGTEPTSGSDAPEVATGAPVPGTPCTASARACVDVAARVTWLLDGGEVVHGPVAMRPGDAEGPTPKGVFAVQWKAEQWTSRESYTQMPYSVFFAPGGVAFHQGSMDTPSAGCVKLSEAEAQRYFATLQVGDEVQVY
ncbi:MAG: L,D-transpeptidase [Pseudonocardia sp.]|nr:L,D-transpeptidase [Pseudonocardia sp.]